MARTVAALAFLALLSVAHADSLSQGRSLSAHRASGGSSLHGLAVSDAAALSSIPTVTNIAPYYTTNGNGTWATNSNRAFLLQSNCRGAKSTTTVGATAIVNRASTLFKQGAGITDVSFPSRLLGIAVGLSCAAIDIYTNIDTNALTAATTQAVPYLPSILTTFDQGATWQVVTGFSTTPLSFAQTQQRVNNLPGAGPAGTPSFFAPDLMSSHCTTRSLCFAAGGYGGVHPLATTAANAAFYHITASTSATNPAIVADSLPIAGAILRSTNGGTFWTYVTLPPMVAATSTAAAIPLPGFMDINTDSSGRYVYAVGPPFVPLAYTAPATNSFPIQQAVAAAPTVESGTIIFSGAYGVSNSWVVQTPPSIPGMWYGLNAITVLRGHASITVGGSPFGVSYDNYAVLVLGTYTGAVGSPAITATATYNIPSAAPLAQSGIVLMTLNGGFSWIQQPLPGWTYYSERPIIQTVSSTSNHLPVLNDVACYNAVVATVAFYNCMAVGRYGYVVKASYPLTSIASSTSSIATISSTVTAWSFVNITQVAQTSGYLDLYGISWDNNLVGYIYGEATILSTHDGGLSWLAETPNGLITSATTNIVSLATVPTTY